MSSIEISGLRKSFGHDRSLVWALDGVDLICEPGEYLAVVGASGSGKSTLLHLVAGLDEPTAGTIHVAGALLSTLDEDARTRLRREHIGLVFQAFNLIDVLTVEENVALPLVVDGESEDRAATRARTMLERVGLSARINHLPGELSGGEQQRVALARALVITPDILLADEPTGNLDSQSGARVMGLIGELAAAEGRTVLMATHNPEHAAMARRRIELRDGRMIADTSA